MCAKHYQRTRKYGDPHGFKVKPAPTTKLKDEAPKSRPDSICVGCGEVVKNLSRGPLKKWCSMDCKMALWHSMRKISNPYAPRCSVSFQTCEFCEQLFTSRSRRTTRACRADDCQRGLKNDQMRSYTARVKERDGESPTQKCRPRKSKGAICVVCREELHKSGTGQASRHKRCMGKLSASEKRRKDFERKIRKIAKGTSGNDLFVAGPCRWCGDNFVGIRSAYCSKNCKTSAAFKRRSSGRAFRISPVMRKQIYARDGWTCQLCHLPVDPDIKHPNSWSATLDHIEPQSYALIPDHSPSNLRLAHLWCNSARGNGSNMVKEELISRATSMIWESVAA